MSNVHLIEFWIIRIGSALMLILTGGYGSWRGFAGSETRSVPASLALIILSLAVLDAGVAIIFSATGAF